MPNTWDETTELALYYENEAAVVYDDRNMVMVDTGFIIDPRILSVGEIYAGRTGTPFAAGGPRNYVRKFRVRVNPDDIDNRKMTDVDIVEDGRVPKPYAYYRSTYDGSQVDRLALCIKLVAEREHSDDWQTWIVTAEYSTEMPENGPDFAWRFGNNRDGPQNQPELEKPVVEWSRVTKMVARPYDLTGRPYLNTAGQPLTPAPQRRVTNQVLLITRNFLEWNPMIADQYTDVLNNQECLGYPPGFVLCTITGVKDKWRGPLRYARVTFSLELAYPDPDAVPHVDPVTDNTFYLEGHQPSHLNAGFYQLAPASSPPDGQPGPVLPSRPVPIYRDGVRVSSSPALLDAWGVALPPDGAPVWLNFEDFRYNDLSPIVEGVTFPS
jgi:hypothetical protein